jgi:hypothetical protein
LALLREARERAQLPPVFRPVLVEERAEQSSALRR